MTDWTPCRETDVRRLQELVDAGNETQDRLWAHIDVLRVQLEDRRAEVDRLVAMVWEGHVHRWYYVNLDNRDCARCITCDDCRTWETDDAE